MKPILKPVTNHFINIVREMANHRHKKMIKLAKGYRGRANRCFTVAKQRVYKALQYSYRDRKV
jgi:large subunit ribosomal protein L20